MPKILIMSVRVEDDDDSAQFVSLAYAVESRIKEHKAEGLYHGAVEFAWEAEDIS